MPIIIATLCLFTMAGAVCTVLLRCRGRSFDGMLFKFLSSFGFMSVAFVGFCYNNDANPYFFCLVIFGLMFGLGGDILLGLKEIAPKFRSRLIVMGTSAFLLGHIFFLAAFTYIGGFQWIPFALSCLVAAITLILLKTFKFKVDAKMGTVLIIYYAMLWYKALLSVFTYWATKDLAFILSTVGCGLFIISDTCLAFIYFTPKKSKNKLVAVELSTYYSAQILLALSVAFIESVPNWR